MNVDMVVCFIDESSVLLGHDATSVSNSMQMFRDSVFSSYIVGDRSFLGVARTFMLLTRVPQVLGVCGPLMYKTEVVCRKNQLLLQWISPHHTMGDREIYVITFFDVNKFLFKDLA